MPILSLTTTSTLFPFAKELSSLVWARRCMLISSFSLDIIDKKMNQLHPLAAIGVFMCSQATSINMLELGREDDLMQLLYRIALKSIEQVAGAEAEKEQQILSICDNVGHKLQKIRKCIENGNEEDAQRAMAYVDDVSVFLKRQKRQHDEAREVTSITETPPTAHEERNEAIKTKHEDCYEELTSYVERFRNPENKRINWRKCFDQGQIDQVEEIMKLGSSEDLRSKCKKSMSHSTRK
ncbi:hypothetical protein G6F43_009408 [Rhizopus delemar]|nr:hypothetical protein G6F43_009408 [Rhizopus delemar]